MKRLFRISAALFVCSSACKVTSNSIDAASYDDASTPADFSTGDLSLAGDMNSANAAAFIGTWKLVSGSSSYDCPGSSFPTWQQNDSSANVVVHLQAGTTPNTIIFSQEQLNCPITYSVVGNVATVVGTPQCAETEEVAPECESSADLGNGCAPPDAGHVWDAGAPFPVYQVRSESFSLAADGQHYTDSFTYGISNYSVTCDCNREVTFDCSTTGTDIFEKQP